LQTKNVSGRLLVGLRWWNEVTDEGDNWRFESLEEVRICAQSKIADTSQLQWLKHVELTTFMCWDMVYQGQRQINSKDSWVFWWALYLTVRPQEIEAI
jgi:Eukaryotic protein of unknown function (DUF846)